MAEIRRAIENGVKIAVYGDYDVDGVTSTCILIQQLRKMGADCTYYIPDRLGEGYGLNVAAIQSLYDDGCRLLITVDSGITAEEEAQFARKIGLRLIITDHHECKETVPEAAAVVNPRRPDSAYPFRELAGVGVAFKLICALERERPVQELMREYADVVAVGTIADVMPLTGENRVIVSYGLGCLRQTKNHGLRALMQKLGLDSKPVTSNSVSFVMAPRINAAGRLGGASIAARMFLTDDPVEATALAERLCELNHQRQEAENGIYANVDIPPWAPKVTDRLLDLPRKEKIYKILASHPDIPADRLAGSLPEDTYSSVAERKLLQIMGRTATNWNGVRNMLDTFGINPAQAVFFGDDNDDIEPIRQCGCGVAVRNALETVLETADEITESNDEDGVARFLERLMNR